MKNRWEDRINLILGVWLFFSPLILQYATLGAAAWNAYLLGLAIVAFALWHLYAPEAWKEWTNLALGVWLVISPWILGFANNTVVTTNMVIVGLVVSAFAAYLAMHEPPQVLKQRH